VTSTASDRIVSTDLGLEHVFADVGLDQVVGDRGDRVEPGLAGSRCSKLAV
jgi:hypothetical protein